jgi:hypothetical protein
MIQTQTWQERRDDLAEIADRNPTGWVALAISKAGLNRLTDLDMLRFPEINLRHWVKDEQVKAAVYRMREAYGEVLEAMSERMNG